MKEKSDSPYRVRADTLSDTTLVPKEFRKGGTVGAKIAFGTNSSFSVATRMPGYHSKAHRHDSEQMAYVAAGSAVIFIENDGFLVQKGDFFRVPRNVIHWSRVVGDEPCVFISSYSPPIMDDGFLKTAFSLLGPNESVEEIKSVKTDYSDNFDSDAVERRVMPRYARP